MGGYGSVVRRNEGRLWVMPERERAKSGAWDKSGRCAKWLCWGSGWEMLGQEMVECGSFVRREQSGGWEVTDRLYGVVRENTLDFQKILYRLFSDTL